MKSLFAQALEHLSQFCRAVFGRLDGARGEHALHGLDECRLGDDGLEGADDDVVAVAVVGRGAEHVLHVAVPAVPIPLLKKVRTKNFFKLLNGGPSSVYLD